MATLQRDPFLYSEVDRSYMQMALDQAREAYETGDYPVGAVLCIDGELIGTARNSLFSDNRWTGHAEHNLLSHHSARMLAQWRGRELWQACLYTTLEPCLMCLGTALIHRISRIVIACPDPNGGCVELDFGSIGSFYSRWKPTIEVGLFAEQSHDLIVEFLRGGKFSSSQMMLREFAEMRARWE